MKISCKTEASSWITIQCEDQTFSIECNSSNKTSIVGLDFNNAVIERKCHTICDDQSKYITIQGTLFFHETRDNTKIFYEKESQVSQPIHWLQDLRLPDVKPIINTMKKHWQITVASVAAVAIGMGVTYLFGPAVILVLIKSLPIVVRCIVKCATGILWAAWVTLRFLLSIIRWIRSRTNQ